MKKILLAILLGTLSCQVLDAQFTHPGILVNTADLNRMKARINIQPWKSGYDQLVANYQNYTMQGPFQEVGREPNVNLTAYESDMAAAYYLAVLWYITNNTTYAQKAMQIIDGWATTHTIWSGNTWTGLERGLNGTNIAAAAEILRYTYPGWDTAKTNHCVSYFNNMIWNPLGPWTDPVNDNIGTGNQGIAVLTGLMAVGIFLDDTTKFNYVVNAFRNNYCDALSRNSLPTGQNGETGRDQAHSMLEMEFMTEVAELAGKQGTDIYADLNNRILAVSEHWSSYNLGNTVSFSPFGPCSGSYGAISPTDRGIEYPVAALEQINGSYVLRKGLTAPYSNQYRALCSPIIETLLYDQDTPPATPAPPAVIHIAVGYSEVALDWPQVIGAVSYTVKRATTSGGPYTNVATGLNGTIFIDTALTNGTPYYYVISTTGAAEGANSTQVAARPMALSLTDADIGAVPTAGSLSFNNGTYTQTGSGSDISSANDQLNFGYTQMTGDGSITVRLASSNGGKVGVMMRDSVTKGARFIMVMYDNGTGGYRIGYRKGNNDVNTYYAGSATGPLPQWLRLTRSGGSFSGYYSPDGHTWTYFGSASVSMNNTVLVGLALCGRGALRTASFDNLTIKGMAPTPTGLTGTSVSNSHNNLRWNAAPLVSGYNVYHAQTSGGPYTLIASSITDTTFSDTGLTKATWYYVVTSLNFYGESAYSSEIGVSPVPDSPTGLSARSGNAQVFLRWASVSGAIGYRIKRGVDTTGFTLVGSSAHTIYDDSSVTNGNTYYYVVTAYNNTGEGSAASPVSATPSADSPVIVRWTGAANAAWDTTTANWKRNGIAASYREGNAVWLDDSAANTSISVSGVRSPAWVAVNNSALSYTLGGAALSGNMSLIKAGSGALTLTAANTYTGGTVLNEGILAPQNNTALGSGLVTLNGGTLQLYNSSNTYTNNILVNGNVTIASGTASGFKAFTYNGALSGTGTVLLINNGANNMPFYVSSGGGWNAFSGKLIYDEGYVSKGFSWTVTPTLDMRNAAFVIQNTVNYGANLLTLNGVGTSYMGSLSQTGSAATYISMGSGDTLSIGHLGASTTYGGILSGAGSLALTGGVLTLSGANTYTGATLITGGQLIITGSLPSGGGNVTVNAGAILSGNGSIGSSVISYGKISLIDGQGLTLGIGGALTLHGGGSIDLELATPATSDLISMSGMYTAPVEGRDTLNFYGLTGFGIGAYPLLAATAGIDTAGLSNR